MAKRIRFAAGIAVIIFLAICAFPAVSQAAPCQEGGITIVPASGTPLALKPGSKYHAVLDFNGKRVDANIQVPACAQPTPASSPEVNGTPSVKAPDSTGVSRTEEPQSQPMWLGL